MKKIKLEELKAGYSYTKPIYLDEDTVFINANTAITDNDLNKLKKFGVSEVLTNGEISQSRIPEIKNTPVVKLKSGSVPEEHRHFLEIFEEINQQKARFSELYNKSQDLIRDIYTNIANDKPVEINIVRTHVENLVDHFKTNHNFSYLLLNMPVSGYYLYIQVTFSLYYSLLIGQILEMSRPKLIELGIAAFFADIGMTKIPSAISEKTSKLSDDELKIFIKHPLVGYQILTQKVKMKTSLAAVCLQHHENFIGTGYPQKISGNNIEEFSRIYTIADNFSALINNRPWRKKSLPYEVMKSMISTDVNKFDLSIIKKFLSSLSMYPVGSAAQLSDNRIGLVLLSNTDKPLRPVLRIILDESGAPLNSAVFVDLSREPQIFITKALDSHKYI